MDRSRVPAFGQTQGTDMHGQARELTLDELERVSGGWDLGGVDSASPQLQAATAAQQQGYTQVSNSSKQTSATVYAILGNFR